MQKNINEIPYVWYADSYLEMRYISTMTPTSTKEIDCTYIWSDLHLKCVTASL